MNVVDTTVGRQDIQLLLDGRLKYVYCRKMSSQRDFDIVVYGATGYTGRLVAEHVNRTQADGEGVRWALAGRSHERLEETRRLIGAADDTTLIVADAADPTSLQAMVDRTRAVVTTVGPYQRYGSELVAACARTGTDYLDLCGEPAWMRRMIDDHEASARASGTRILFSCGFDSLPSELGVWFCQQVATARTGAPVPRVKGRVRSFVGGISGGSVATRDAIMASVERDPALADLLQDPFCLTPGFSGPEQPPTSADLQDPDVGVVGPFMLGPTNAKSVHRSNFLMGHPYGTDFQYDEMLVHSLDGPPAAPPGAGPAALPQPGEGPSREARLAGSFDMLFIGVADNGQQVRVSVKGDQDPGYGSTAKMLTETAICLLSAGDVAGGVWTPAAALQQRLLDRLQAHAGLTFTDETQR